MPPHLRNRSSAVSKAPTVLHTEEALPMTPISASLDRGHSGYWLDLRTGQSERAEACTGASGRGGGRRGGGGRRNEGWDKEMAYHYVVAIVPRRNDARPAAVLWGFKVGLNSRRGSRPETG